MKRTNPLEQKAVIVSQWIFIGLLAYMPLHIFLSTWFGTTLGLLSVTRVLKDVVMLFGFLLILIPSLKKKWFKELLRDKLVLVILAYGLLTFLLALLSPTDIDAEILGVVYNTRFLVFFLYALLLAKTVDFGRLRRNSLTAVLASAVVVLCFGVIQYTYLPNKALEHVGYTRANGVLPAFFIDEKPDLERIMSTLRDPNSLGSYVLIISSISLVLLLFRRKYKDLATGFLILSMLCLWYTFSRSAWLGFGLSLVVVLAYKVAAGGIPKKWLKIGILAGVIGFVVLASSLVIFRNSYFVQNVVFHADESTVLEDPNELRVRFWRESIEDVANEPLGSGPGTAGLASIRNNVQGTELNENYYLQIASEVGLIGIVLFLAILFLVGQRLAVMAKTDWLALALLASFAGLAVTNFLVHIWSNEAVAYTWWGLAGITLFKVYKSDNKEISKD